jgi:hypothetical protein
LKSEEEIIAKHRKEWEESEDKKIKKVKKEVIKE